MSQLHLGQNALFDYVADHSSRPASYLNELERASHRRVINGKMVSGAHQGRILSMVSRLISPRVILEVGTFTGYSALCLAEGLQNDGHLITMERNEELNDIQDEFWKRSPYFDRITRLVGDARRLITTIEEIPDLVFLDADKSIYQDIWNALSGQLRSGAVVLVDNVLWHGKVLEPLHPEDLDTKAIQEFNELVAADQRFETVILPIRDGITIIRRK